MNDDDDVREEEKGKKSRERQREEKSFVHLTTYMYVHTLTVSYTHTQMSFSTMKSLLIRSSFDEAHGEKRKAIRHLYMCIRGFAA